MLDQQPNTESASVSESPFKGKTGFKRLINAVGYSIEGFKAAFHHEDAFRQEIFFTLILIPLALYLESHATSRALMIGSLFLVLIVELLNSAVEAVVDRVSIERHALAKRAKDIGSAAVFVAIANVIVVWALILLG